MPRRLPPSRSVDTHARRHSGGRQRCGSHGCRDAATARRPPRAFSFFAARLMPYDMSCRRHHHDHTRVVRHRSGCYLEAPFFMLATRRERRRACRLMMAAADDNHLMRADAAASAI